MAYHFIDLLSPLSQVSTRIFHHFMQASPSCPFARVPHSPIAPRFIPSLVDKSNRVPYEADSGGTNRERSPPRGRGERERDLLGARRESRADVLMFRWFSRDFSSESIGRGPFQTPVREDLILGRKEFFYILFFESKFSRKKGFVRNFD